MKRKTVSLIFVVMMAVFIVPVYAGCEDCDESPVSGPAVRVVPYMPEGTVISPRDDRHMEITTVDSVVLYFYAPWCPFCYEISPIMNNLPEYVMIDGQRSYIRKLSFNRDIAEDLEIIGMYHELLNILPERRLVPQVIIGNRDIFLYAEVTDPVTGVIASLEAGDGLTTHLFTERLPAPSTISAILTLILSTIGLATIIIVAIFLHRVIAKYSNLHRINKGGTLPQL